MQAQQDVEVSLARLERAVTDAVAVAGASVVRVNRRRGAGSGLAWTDTLVVTANFHTPDQPTVTLAGPDGPREVAARLVGRDPGTDVAVLAVDAGGLTPLVRRSPGPLGAGQLGFALARPGQAIRSSLRALGVVGPAIRTPAGGRLDAYLETDRALPRGFAGGPLVDLAGALVGMNTRTLCPGADVCVPVSTLARVVDALVAHGRIARGYLGLAVQPAAIAPAVSDGRGRGALVVALDEGGPAAHGGLLVGDVIIAVDGEIVDGPAPLQLAIGDRPGATAVVELVRGGVRTSASVAVGTRP
ncbi:MAG: PDZ domain-containing protein [Kofleriaceae bacterium]